MSEEEIEQNRISIRHSALDFALRMTQMGTTSYNVQPSELMKLAVRIENYLTQGASNHEPRTFYF